MSQTDSTTQSITIRAPDDFHVHLREGEALATTVPHTAATFVRAAVMPNLKEPICSPTQALHYLEAIQAHTPKEMHFTPLMCLYLNEKSQSAWVSAVQEHPNLLAFKYYPAHATTNAAHGVRHIESVYPILEAMEACGVPLQVHGEVTDPSVDIFDREARFIETVLMPTLVQFPKLRVVLEHITTRESVQFVQSNQAQMGATITPHHLMLNRNDMLVGGISPHHYCLPVLKRSTHQTALREAATSGEACFFLGTDSAPHERRQKESSCGCAGIYSAHAAMPFYAAVFESMGHLDKLENFASAFGAAFYRLKPNTKKITLMRESWKIPQSYPSGDGQVVPLSAGQTIGWRVI